MTHRSSAKLDRPRGVILVSPWGGPDSYSGPALFANRLFKGLNASGVRVTAIGAGPGPFISTDVAEIPTRRIGSGQDWWQRLWWMVAASRALWKVRRSYSIAHLQGCYLDQMVLGIVAQSLGMRVALMPVVESGDLAVSSSRPQASIQAAVRRRVIPRSSACFCLSPGIATEYVNLGGNALRAVEFPNCVDTDEFAPRPLAKGPRSAVTIGFVGEVGQRKGAVRVVEQIHSLVASGHEADALFIGPFESAAFESEFWAFVDQLGLRSRVRVTGYVASAAPFIRDELDVFFLPSQSEGLPAGLIEAVACGVPVVVTSVGGMATVVDQSGAGLVVGDDPGEQLVALESLVRDREVRRALGSAGRTFAVERFSVTAAVHLYKAALDL